MRCSVVVPFQMSHFPAPKQTQQLQRALNDHPKLTIAIAFINSVNHPTSVGLHNNLLKLHLYSQSNPFLNCQSFSNSRPIFPIQHSTSRSNNQPPAISNNHSHRGSTSISSHSTINIYFMDIQWTRCPTNIRVLLLLNQTIQSSIFVVRLSTNRQIPDLRMRTAFGLMNHLISVEPNSPHSNKESLKVIRRSSI